MCEADGVRLFHNDGKGSFSDVTEKAGIRREKGCVAPAFVDYDHDGDLDLYLTVSPQTTDTTVRANRLWRNNGNSTFTDVSQETGLGVAATGGGVAFTDFNTTARSILFLLVAPGVRQFI